MLSDIEILAAITFGVRPWLKVEVKEDKSKSEIEKIGWVT